MEFANQHEELSKGCRVLSIEAYGVSFWANTSRINVELANRTPHTFFIKMLSKEVGKNMVRGKFESMKAIYKLLPDFVPRPIALCEFREMIDQMPEPENFSRRLAALHKNSRSPNGKFDFHSTIYSGNLP